MINKKDLLNKLREWANLPPAQFLNDFEPLYKKILKKDIPACKCPNKIQDAVIELYSFVKKTNNMEKIVKCVSRLKAGVVLYMPFGKTVKTYTNRNLTDEVAREFLEKHPKLKYWFSVLPPVETPTETPKKRGRKPPKK